MPDSVGFVCFVLHPLLNMYLDLFPCIQNVTFVFRGLSGSIFALFGGLEIFSQSRICLTSLLLDSLREDAIKKNCLFDTIHFVYDRLYSPSTYDQLGDLSFETEPAVFVSTRIIT
jgi:hypothetical protein